MKSIIKLLIITLLLSGCSKEEFLNEKPKDSLIIPTTLKHFQALLDRDDYINGTDGQGVTPQLGESGADNFYLLDADFNANLRPQMQNYYTWSVQPYAGVEVLDWRYPYRAILVANTVLNHLDKIDASKADLNYLKAQALFHRAHLFYQLAQVFAPPYRKGELNDEISIPLRMTEDINEVLVKSTVGETYTRIVGDLKESVQYLKENNDFPTRPSKQAGYALLSRISLMMQDYTASEKYADSCLAITDFLLDYNLINMALTEPLTGKNQSGIIKPEVIYWTGMLAAPFQYYPTTFLSALIPDQLYNSYAESDLRRKLFFEKRPTGYRFRGTYNYFSTRSNYFSGLAVDEVFLNRAECRVRNGRVTPGLDDLNHLLEKRWEKGKYVPVENLSQADALKVILDERRKELIFRGIRWSDLRRLNIDGANITLERTVNGNKYVLPPNDPRWTWPFPMEVTAK
ncbi:RagB/SusD family nutrient uptake outer membrane protein [Sphingobacterium sp.]|uniref:RagB/SusD family nutrient uptake outer membrane protein n=1 Tax=Sphingobacterium sp. TaxID=341027 RepID=UPI0031DBB2DC